ncbi:MAG TPA: TIGR03087 family PEP-CTERM/XrtA system glycosyltransferase [Allosphingosinicella sp.]|jgi:sugar transferase (PEP-CTERM/EpsH1 system associated)|uniref:TIGR03087 family PEP-CTERM/XrtA system glycosyltransferase n=1 Tax=Allosphingosinicella sp. TaxID=2823234 RepID=UPI002F2A0326
MRDILFLAHRIPYPPDRGDKIRSWNILKHLGTLGRVHLASFADDAADAAHLPALRAVMGGSLGEAHVEVRTKPKLTAAAEALREGKPISLTAFDSAAMRGFVRRMLERDGVDTVFAFSSQMAQFVPAKCRQRFIMDFVDMDSAKFAAYGGKGPMRWIHRREAVRLLEHEQEVASRADASLFVSPGEAALFRERTRAANVHAVCNGIDLDFYNPTAGFDRLPEQQSPLLVFTGQMDYRPNAEAVLDFADKVLPIILQTRPEVRFAIVGRNPTAAVRRLADRPNVIVTGAVPDVRSWLAAANVAVAPLGIARGIQNKVLEAMAMARPVVASAAAFEGINAVPGRDLIVTDRPEAQAWHVLDLLAHPQDAAEIGAAARRRMETRYRWEAQLAPLAALLGRAPRLVAA